MREGAKLKSDGKPRWDVEKLMEDPTPDIRQGAGWAAQWLHNICHIYLSGGRSLGSVASKGRDGRCGWSMVGNTDIA